MYVLNKRKFNLAFFGFKSYFWNIEIKQLLPLIFIYYYMQNQLIILAKKHEKKEKFSVVLIFLKKSIIFQKKVSKPFAIRSILCYNIMQRSFFIQTLIKNGSYRVFS